MSPRRETDFLMNPRRGTHLFLFLQFLLVSIQVYLKCVKMLELSTERMRLGCDKKVIKVDHALCIFVQESNNTASKYIQGMYYFTEESRVPQINGRNSEVTPG